MRDRIQPVIDRVLQLRLAVTDHADHGLEPRRGIGLSAGQFRHHRGLRVRALPRPPQQNRERDQRQAGQNAAQDRGRRDGFRGGFLGQNCL